MLLMDSAQADLLAVGSPLQKSVCHTFCSTILEMEHQNNAVLKYTNPTLSFQPKFYSGSSYALDAIESHLLPLKNGPSLREHQYTTVLT